MADKATETIRSDWCQDNGAATGKKIECGPLLTTYANTDSEWTKDLNVSDETQKTQGVNLHNLGTGVGHLDQEHRRRERKYTPGASSKLQASVLKGDNIGKSHI